MLAIVRIIALVCGPVALGGLLAAGPALLDRAAMIRRHLGNHTDGVGLGTGYASCGPASFLQIPCAASTTTAPALGEHVLLWHEDGNGPGIATTPLINTQPSGSALIVFSAGYASNTLPPTDSKGNTWTPLGAPAIYRGYNGEFNVKAYLATSARGGNGHSVSIVKNGNPSGEITVPFVEVRQSSALHAVAQNYPSSAPVVTSGNVTTTAAATLGAVWWGDATGLQHSAIPNNGFSIIENFVNLPPNSAVQCVVAARQVVAAGTYNVSWTQSPSEGAILWLLAFQADDPVFASGFD